MTTDTVTVTQEARDFADEYARRFPDILLYEQFTRAIEAGRIAGEKAATERAAKVARAAVAASWVEGLGTTVTAVEQAIQGGQDGAE